MAADRDRGEGGRGGPGGGSPQWRGRGRPGRAYSLFVGAAFIALVAVALVNTLRTGDGGLLGAGDERGMAAPQFAVPEALGPVEGDANVFQDDCEGSEVPCPADQRRVPACEVRGNDIIRACDLFDRPLVLSFWFTRGADCLPTQDVVDAVAQRYGGRVNFLSINVRDDRESVRETIRDRGWSLPVGYDADGAVSNIYRVGVCPTVAFLYPGGILREARVGSAELDEASLTEHVDRLLRESRRLARTDR